MDTLSGGERFRAVLATVRLAVAAAVFDEATNKPRHGHVGELGQALAVFEGSLLVASHDIAFLRTLGIARWLCLGRASGLEPIERAPANR